MTDTLAPPLEADISLIQRIIPHRYPFLLVDKVVEYEEGKVRVITIICMEHS